MLHPFSMNVDAPMWSACTAGGAPSSCGAFDGCAFLSVFHASMSSSVLSRSAVSSAIWRSTLLKSAPMSRLRGISSASVSAPDKRAASASCAARSESSVASVTISCRCRRVLVEYDTVGARQHAVDVEHHDELVVDLGDAAHCVGGESFEQRRRGRHGGGWHDRDFDHGIGDGA